MLGRLSLERRSWDLRIRIWPRSLLNFTHHAGRLRNTTTAATTARASQQALWPDSTLWFAVCLCSVFHGCGLWRLWRASASAPIGLVLHRNHYRLAGRGVPDDHVDGVGDDAFRWEGQARQGAVAEFGYSIAVIDITGVILSPETVDSQLRKFGDDSSVKAIILHINSPGGGAAASQEIYHEVLRVRQEKHKKIIASIESVGASGRVLLSPGGCDKIYANDASVVGSIGVIMEWTNYGDLMRWAKLKNVIIHAGELEGRG